MTTITIKGNNDTGSLKVGTAAGDKAWKVGDKLKIVGGVDGDITQGEGKTRAVTYVMGKGEKCHLCFKGQGPLPLGEVVIELVEE
jgi:hypothetical protein